MACNNITVVTAKDEEHFRLLKGLLITAFAKPVRVLDEGWANNQLDAQLLSRSQKRTLEKLNYQIG